jgi:CubicO group peptidase (beta-lactamase class C family)
MRFPILGVAAAALIAAPASAATDSRFAPVHDAVSQAIAGNTVPGAIILIRKNGRVVFEEAQGVADGQPLHADTVFWVASMTKPLVAASLMMLVDEGKVRLDDPVSKYIPEFAKPRRVRTLAPGAVLPAPGPPGAPGPKLDWTYAPADRALTVRDMITMTGGLQTIRVPNEAIPPVSPTDTLATFTAKLGEAPLDFQPGSRWGYSNATEFEVVARIVEVASGKSFQDFVQTRLFDPLGMTDSHFGVREDLQSRIAPLGNMATSPLVSGRFASGSAGLWTTAQDYGRFAQMLLDNGRANGRRFLKPATVKAMSSNQIGALSLAGLVPNQYGGLPQSANPAVKYGYGLLSLQDSKGAGTAVPVGSFGWDGVGSRRFWVIPSEHAVLVMLAPAGQADVLHRAVERAAVTLLAK